VLSNICVMEYAASPIFSIFRTMSIKRSSVLTSAPPSRRFRAIFLSWLLNASISSSSARA